MAATLHLIQEITLKKAPYPHQTGGGTPPDGGNSPPGGGKTHPNSGDTPPTAATPHPEAGENLPDKRQKYSYKTKIMRKGRIRAPENGEMRIKNTENE